MELSKEELEEIIEKDIPGHRMSRKSFRNQTDEVDAARALDMETPEASTPDVETLREKYLQDKFFGSKNRSESAEMETSAERSASPKTKSLDEEPEDIIVSVKPKQSSGMRDDSSQLKAAVISGAEKKVIGQQG
jgi:hypothetical protein